MISTYRLAPGLVARLIGATSIVIGGLVALVTAMAVVLSAPTSVVVVTAVAGLVLIVTLVLVLTRLLFVVRLTDEGYQVRLLRRPGVKRARWGEVQEAASAQVRGVTCLVLRLSDGRSTTIPVAALAGDRDDFAADVRARLTAARGSHRRA
ncbi:MAG: hypothetical protein ACRCYQ_07250 [Nocardioides sp.]